MFSDGMLIGDTEFTRLWQLRFIKCSVHELQKAEQWRDMGTEGSEPSMHSEPKGQVLGLGPCC